jgi:uncharacterized protein (DUF697 family)
MHTLSRPLRATRLLTLLREVDLGALKREAEGRFALHLGGDPGLAAELAENLSATPGRSGVHPYLEVQTANVTTGVHPDLRIVVQEGFAAVPTDRVPTLVVCVAGDTPPVVGAEVARPGETARVAVSALTPESVQQTIVPALLRALPAELHLAVARQLPVCRPAVIRGLIEETSRTNALYAASTGVAEIVPVLNVPLNVADTVVLTKNQLLMAYKVALAADKTGKPQELVTEIVGVLGGGLLFRQAARGLVGLVPLWGLVPKVAVAYAGTQVIGTAAALWATEGRTVSAGDMQGLYREALERGRALAQRLLPKQRGRAEGLPEVLPEAPELPELEPPKED